jgi:hypothetical protein
LTVAHTELVRQQTHLLAARELPGWFVRDVLNALRYYGLAVSTMVGIISLFGSPPTAIPAVAMLASATLFFASMRVRDDGMMVIRALGLLGVASFVRAASIVLFLRAVPLNNALAAGVIWSSLAVVCFLSIRVLITWGVVVRPPKHRW